MVCTLFFHRSFHQIDRIFRSYNFISLVAWMIFFHQPEIIASGSLSNVTDINNSSMLMQVKSNSILINILTV